MNSAKKMAFDLLLRYSQLYYKKMNEGINNASNFAQSEISEAYSVDKFAGKLIESQTLKLIFETILTLAYALFLIGIMLSLATDEQTRDNFVEYLRRTVSVVEIIILMVLGVLVYSLSKAYHADKKYSLKTKRNLNFLSDVIKGVIFVLMIVFISEFVWQNSQKTQVVIAYWAYIIAMVLFKIIHVLKWYYYCCGPGRETFNPWMPAQRPEEQLNEEEKGVVKQITREYLKLKKEGKNMPFVLREGHIQTLPDDNPEVPNSERVMNQ